MRNDSILFTGMTSNSINKADKALKARKKATEEKASQRSKIMPAVEPIIELIKKERDLTISSLLSVVDSNTSEDDLKATVVALNLYRQSIDKLQNSITRIMRVKE